jgi:hypothetical protein
MNAGGDTFCCVEPLMAADEFVLRKTVAWMDWRSRHPKGMGAPRIEEIEKSLERRVASERYCHIDG